MRKMATDAIVNFQAAPARGNKTQNNIAPASNPHALWPRVVIGRLTGFENTQPTVDFPGNPKAVPLLALTGVSLSSAEIGRDVILAFADGDPEKPIILNLLIPHQTELAKPTAVDIQADGEKLLVTAKKEIVLRCGEASITLTAAGKVLLKGTYVLSRSSGYNKIKGAAVDIN